MRGIGKPIAGLLGLTLLSTCAVSAPALADGRDGHHHDLLPGNLLISRSVYATPDIQPGVTQLPPGCATAPIGSCGTAVADGTYPSSFNNDSVDAFFGVTSPVFLDEVTPRGDAVATITVPTDQFVTSFSSKSELALNLSPEGKYVSFMGYAAKPAMIDVSNANTPGVLDPGNGDVGPYYRVVAQLDEHGHFTFTETNAYSGDNGRAAITNDENGQDLLYAAGNAGQSKHPIPGVVAGAGAQFITPATVPEAQQTPGQPTPLGSFNITELGDPIDKASKDNNYRGITVHDNVIYYTKGSGGNGVNTVYFVDTTGKACPNGVGLPDPNAQLPTSPPSFSITNFGTTKSPNLGVTPTNMCILKGFPAALATPTPTPANYPFGMWFANDHTLYVADEGSGDSTFANGQYVNATASAQPEAGLEKWVFDNSSQSWKLAYTLQNGLNLGVPYTIPGYPDGTNPATGGQWSPATDGLRGITGRVGRDGRARIWAVTSTVSGGGDTGADPDQVVKITDDLDATTLPASEQFRTFEPPTSGVVYRGVSFTPGTHGHHRGGDHGDGGDRHFARDHRGRRGRR